MGRRRRDRGDSYQADAFFTQTRTLTPPALLRLPPMPLPDVEDRRTFNPDGVFRPAKTIYSGGPAGPLRQGRIPTKKAKTYQPTTVAFEAPKAVAVCVRRKQRKEVIHALRKAGRGARRRKPRRNFYSGVQC